MSAEGSSGLAGRRARELEIGRPGGIPPGVRRPSQPRRGVVVLEGSPAFLGFVLQVPRDLVELPDEGLEIRCGSAAARDAEAFRDLDCERLDRGRAHGLRHRVDCGVELVRPVVLGEAHRPIPPNEGLVGWAWGGRARLGVENARLGRRRPTSIRLGGAKWREVG
jgi:hypothetical protein